MRYKRSALLSLCAVLVLLSFLLGMICGYVIYSKNESEGNPNTKTGDLLNGTLLKTMMNEAKMSPGIRDAYARDHPMYAYLFDGSFITYIEENE